MNLMQRGYERALHYGANKNGGRLGPIHEKYIQAEQIGSRLVRDIVTNTRHDLSSAVGGSVEAVSDSRVAFNLSYLFRESKM